MHIQKLEQILYEDLIFKNTSCPLKGKNIINCWFNIIPKDQLNKATLHSIIGEEGNV